MDDYKKLEERIKKIESRNLRVEKDKAWEISLARKMLLIVFTYLMIALYMRFVLNIDPWLNAIIPTLGFYLSTLTLPFFRKIWEKLFYKS